MNFEMELTNEDLVRPVELGCEVIVVQFTTNSHREMPKEYEKLIGQRGIIIHNREHMKVPFVIFFHDVAMMRYWADHRASRFAANELVAIGKADPKKFKEYRDKYENF